LKNFKITAKTLEGLEEVLAAEIRAIGGTNITVGKRAVDFEGDMGMIYRANYYLRTALRIFRQIESFTFTDIDDFYLGCMKIRWESFLNINDSFSIQSTVFHSPQFRNSMFASLKVKDAIADRFRQKHGRRPDVDTKSPDILFHVHISHDKCTISLDSSGESLHKRGYRQLQGEAPLNEVLAAGMILLSGWNGETDFVDPMCGSGTLPIEAALMAKNIPPGKFRKEYAFMNWHEYDPGLFTQIREESVIKEFRGKIYASDIRNSSMLAAQTNARSARVFNLIQFKTTDFAKLDLEVKNAHILINPPYGERLEVHEIEGLYAMIGERLKHHFTGNEAWILSSAPQLMHKIGLKPGSRVRLFNGALECSFQKYEMFSGKQKQFRMNHKKEDEIKPSHPGKKKSSE
jgi:putative N6-adenine-specific DNA methylase